MREICYKKIVLLCDYGLDDAIATAYILEHSSMFEKIDIMPIGGNMPLKISFNNALRILNNLEYIPDNVRIVDSSIYPQPEEYLDFIHGRDGMGDILPKESNASDKIDVLDFNSWIDTVGSDYLIVCLGPCTIAEKILQHKENLPLLIMGGNIAEKPNHNEYEFNHGMDTKAFSFCVKHSHFIATLDSCHHPLCDFYKIDVTDNKLSSRFIRRYVELSKERNEKESYIYDFVTVLFLFKPEKFNVIKCTDRDGNKLSMLKYIDNTPII